MNDRIYAVFSNGPELVAVKVSQWTDGEAMLIPRTGGKLVKAAEGPGFLGLWVKPTIEPPPPPPSPDQIYLRPCLKDQPPRRSTVADLVANLRKRFPGVKADVRLRFQYCAPEPVAAK